MDGTARSRVEGIPPTGRSTDPGSRAPHRAGQRQSGYALAGDWRVADGGGAALGRTPRMSRDAGSHKQPTPHEAAAHQVDRWVASLEAKVQA